MFYQLDWQQMEKNWKVICTASFYFIVTHYSRFCSLISASSALAMQGEREGEREEEKKVAAAAHQRSWFVFSVFSLEVCHPELQQKSNYSLMSSLSSAFQCKDLRSRPRASTPPAPHPPSPASPSLPRSLQADNQPRRRVSALWYLAAPYLTASPQSQDKVLFSQLTGGWCRIPPNPLFLAWK